MALDVRKYLAELMGVEKLTDADLRTELDELKVDNELAALTRDGHIAADPETQARARKAITGQATVDDIRDLLKTAKPTPASTTTLTPAAGPSAGSSGDPEAAIQAVMTTKGIPYHEAAIEVSTGAKLNGGGL